MQKILFVFILQMCPLAIYANVKIAFVDMQKIMLSTKMSKKITEQLEKDYKKQKNELKKQEDELKKKAESFEKRKLVLSNEAEKQQQDDLQKEFLVFRENVAKSQYQIDQHQKKLTQPLIEKIQKTIAEIAKEKSLSAVFNQPARDVVWSDLDLNLTGEVIKKIDF